QDAAARPQGQPLDMPFLGLVRRGPEGVAVGGLRRPPEGQPADLLRRRDVAVQEGRREVAQGGAVEAVIGLVGRQQRRGVHVQRQEVPDGVLVFGAVQPSQGGGSAGVGAHGGRAVQVGLEGGDERLVRLLVRARLAGGGHLPGGQLPRYLFPDL